MTCREPEPPRPNRTPFSVADVIPVPPYATLTVEPFQVPTVIVPRPVIPVYEPLSLADAMVPDFRFAASENVANILVLTVFV